MTVHRAGSLLAGLMILASLGLAHLDGQVDVGRMSGPWLALFVGASLFHWGFTGFCPAASLLRGLGLSFNNEDAACCH